MNSSSDKSKPTNPASLHSVLPTIPIVFGRETDELDIWFSRHRNLILGIYIVIFAVFVILCGINIALVPEIPHLLIHVIRGEPPIDQYQQELISLVSNGNSSLQYVGPGVAAFYILTQGLLLWGVGTIYIGRRSKTVRTVIGISIVSAVAAFLALATACLGQVTFQAMENRYFSVKNDQWYVAIIEGNWIWIIIAGWVFWLLVSVIYWRGKNKDSVIQRLIRTILVTSWVEFSLALPIDLAARTRESCYCAIGSYITLLITLPLLIWSIGPGLYFLYLREREFSLREPGRARAILRQKSRRYARHSPRKVESYVSSARTISLLLIALAFVGMQLGIFNYQRGILFSQTRDLVLVKELKDQFNDNATLQSKIKEAPQGQGQYYKSYEFEKPNFGKVEIRQASENAVTFTAKVGRKEEAWESRPFSLDHDDIETRLNHALSALAISNDNLPTGSKLIERVRDAIYSKRVKLPSVDFGDFGTESAVWLVTLICVSALVALRNVIRRIFWSADMGIGEAWLVLDGGAIGEKLVAGIWISAIGLSGWLATLGLILSVMDVFQGATPRRGVGLAGATFGICAVLMILSSWAGAATVADILRLRQQRRLFDAEAAV